jgi:S1-C subfamily serine protease
MNPRDPFHPTPDPRDPTPSWTPRPTSSWQASSGWDRATIATPAAAPAAPAAAPSTSAPLSSAPRRRRTYGTVLGTALLAAVLATGSTLAVVELSIPHGSGSTTTPPANANVTAQNPSATAGTASVTQDDISGVVAQVKDSVLTLTSQIATNGGGGGRGFPFGGGLGGGTATGIGSGIILTSDGYVLTNRHVVEGSESLKATLADGTEYPATVVKISDTQDLALVKVDATGLRPATIGDSTGIQVGQTAIAIGSPLGTFTDTVTKGIVSALNRTITVQDEQTGRPVTLSGLIQTDAAINPGNSGGPLMNAAGQVVGVNTATAGSAEGIGFAIPINEAQSLIDQAKTASVA